MLWNIPHPESEIDLCETCIYFRQGECIYQEVTDSEYECYFHEDDMRRE